MTADETPTAPDRVLGFGTPPAPGGLPVVDVMLPPLVDHHDGGGLSEKIRVERDARDPRAGHASHYYEIHVDLVPPDPADGWVRERGSCLLCGEEDTFLRLGNWIRCLGCDTHWGPDGTVSPPSLFVGHLQFQHGARREEGSTTGLLDGALIAVLLDRYRAFQTSAYACAENAAVITKLEEALMWMQRRVRLRQAQAVLGKNAPHLSP